MMKSQTFKTITQYSRQMMVKARTVLAKDSKSFPKITKITRDDDRLGLSNLRALYLNPTIIHRWNKTIQMSRL